VDEDALAAALKVEKIAGAALDVLEVEPPPLRHPLYPARSCLITPHNAWATKEARTRLMSEAVENLRAFIGGTPRNVIKPA
jgi:glycerate dehydrogenase